MAIGQRISGILHERGISQNKLAKMAGLSQSGMSSILSGASRPREDTLQAIAKALDISLSELMEDPGTKKEPTASDGQTSPVDGNLAMMYAKFSLLSPADQQRVLDFAEGILSARER